MRKCVSRSSLSLEFRGISQRVKSILLLWQKCRVTTGFEQSEDKTRGMYGQKHLSRRANARNVSEHTLYGVRHIHINLTLINSTIYRCANADQNQFSQGLVSHCTGRVYTLHQPIFLTVQIFQFINKMNAFLACRPRTDSTLVGLPLKLQGG